MLYFKRLIHHLTRKAHHAKYEYKEKIAFVYDTMVVGGVERALLELLRNIDSEYYDITLFLNDSCGSLHSSIPSTVQTRYYHVPDAKKYLLSELAHLRFVSLAKKLWFRFLARRHADEYFLNAYYCIKSLPPCSDEEFDCVIAYHSLSPIIVLTALYRIKGKKKALFVHGRNVLPEKLNPFFDKILKSFDRVFCVSKQMTIDYKRDFPMSGEKTCVMHNLIDAEKILQKAAFPPEIKLPSDVTTLVTVGRVAYVKGQDLIPKAARILLDNGFRFIWYVIGDGDLRSLVEQEISKWDVQNHVLLLGTQLNPYPYIKNCDIYIQPSKSEGWCIAAQEAKILKKPIVCTGIPVMREQFVHGENGILTDSVTSEALAEGISLLLENPQLREKLIHGQR